MGPEEYFDFLSLDADEDEVDALVSDAYQDVLDQVHVSVDPAASFADIMGVVFDARVDSATSRAAASDIEAGCAEPLAVAEPVDPDLKFVLCIGDVLGRTIDTALDLVSTLDSEPRHGHAQALTKALICNLVLARDFEPTLASPSQIGFALDLVSPGELDGDLDAPDKADWARIVARSRFLDFARIFARSLIRVLEQESESVLEIVRQLGELLATASDIGLRHTMVRNLKEIHYIDAVARDLSWLDASDTPVPVGTVWNEYTILPPTQATKIRAGSVKIGWGRRQFQGI